eukprot:m51a1_g9678 hypothetical protein (673) ;mRNA; r:1288998-1291429
MAERTLSTAWELQQHVLPLLGPRPALALGESCRALRPLCLAHALRCSLPPPSAPSQSPPQPQPQPQPQSQPQQQLERPLQRLQLARAREDRRRRLEIALCACLTPPVLPCCAREAALALCPPSARRLRRKFVSRVLSFAAACGSSSVELAGTLLHADAASVLRPPSPLAVACANGDADALLSLCALCSVGPLSPAEHRRRSGSLLRLCVLSGCSADAVAVLASSLAPGDASVLGAAHVAAQRGSADVALALVSCCQRPAREREFWRRQLAWLGSGRGRSAVAKRDAARAYAALLDRAFGPEDWLPDPLLRSLESAFDELVVARPRCAEHRGCGLAALERAGTPEAAEWAERAFASHPASEWCQCADRDLCLLRSMLARALAGDLAGAEEALGACANPVAKRGLWKEVYELCALPQLASSAVRGFLLHALARAYAAPGAPRMPPLRWFGATNMCVRHGYRDSVRLLEAVGGAWEYPRPLWRDSGFNESRLLALCGAERVEDAAWALDTFPIAGESDQEALLLEACKRDYARLAVLRFLWARHVERHGNEPRLRERMLAAVLRGAVAASAEFEPVLAWLLGPEVGAHLSTLEAAYGALSYVQGRGKAAVWRVLEMHRWDAAKLVALATDARDVKTLSFLEHAVGHRLAPPPAFLESEHYAAAYDQWARFWQKTQ